MNNEKERAERQRIIKSEDSRDFAERLREEGVFQVIKSEIIRKFRFFLSGLRDGDFYHRIDLELDDVLRYCSPEEVRRLLAEHKNLVSRATPNKRVTYCVSKDGYVGHYAPYFIESHSDQK